MDPRTTFGTAHDLTDALGETGYLADDALAGEKVKRGEPASVTFVRLLCHMRKALLRGPQHTPERRTPWTSGRCDTGASASA